MTAPAPPGVPPVVNFHNFSRNEPFDIFPSDYGRYPRLSGLPITVLTALLLIAAALAANGPGMAITSPSTPSHAFLPLPQGDFTVRKRTAIALAVASTVTVGMTALASTSFASTSDP